MSKPTSGQLQSIELIRGFSILAVLCGHFLLVPSVREPALAWVAYLMFARNGAYGVTTFFVASGFLITRMIDGPQRAMFTPDKPRFYFRRVSRILPMLFLVCGIGALMLAFGGDRHGALAVTFKDPTATYDGWFWSSILLFFYNWYAILNESTVAGWGLSWGVLWSLAIEEQFYAGYPFLLAWLRSARNLARFLLLVVVVGVTYRFAASLIAPESYLVGFTGSFAAFDQIAIGILAYLARREGWTDRLSDGARTLLFVTGLIVTAATYGLTYAGDPVDRIYGPTLLAFGVGLVLLTGLEHPMFNWAIWRPLKVLGKASYEAYLLHGLVLYVIWPYVLGRAFLVPALLFVVAVTLVSLAVHVYVEEPLKDRLVRGLPVWLKLGQPRASARLAGTSLGPDR